MMRSPFRPILTFPFCIESRDASASLSFCARLRWLSRRVTKDWETDWILAESSPTLKLLTETDHALCNSLFSVNRNEFAV